MEMNDSYEDYLTITEDGLDIEANNINANCITSNNNTFNLDSNGNLTVNTITINDSQSNPLSFEAIFNRIYPIGAIYISTNPTNPGLLFTGSWQAIEGVFLIGANSTYQAGSSGGSATHAHTSAAHSHTSAAHSHGAGNLFAAINFDASYLINHYETNLGSWAPNARKNVSGSSLNFYNTQSEGTNVYGTTASTTPGNTGTTTPNNTGSSSSIPPYLSVYMWKRVS
jgi:hypothetical protein